MNYDKINRRISKLNDVNKELKTQNEIYKSAFDGMMHEIRRFSNELSEYAEEISKLTFNSSGEIKN